jgi:hypothetical protein
VDPKLAEELWKCPVTNADPPDNAAMPWPTSQPLPPAFNAHSHDPDALTFATKMSPSSKLDRVMLFPKLASELLKYPVTNADPSDNAAMPRPLSVSLPPAFTAQLVFNASCNSLAFDIYPNTDKIHRRFITLAQMGAFVEMRNQLEQLRARGDFMMMERCESC